MTTPKITLGPKDPGSCSTWRRSATVDDVTYHVGVDRGRAVRIAFKPRGQNIGHHYNGWVMGPDGRNLWGGRVSGSIGARGLLKRAGVVPLKMVKCWRCSGRGFVRSYATLATPSDFDQTFCTTCQGSGEVTEPLS